MYTYYTYMYVYFCMIQLKGFQPSQISIAEHPNGPEERPRRREPVGCPVCQLRIRNHNHASLVPLRNLNKCGVKERMRLSVCLSILENCGLARGFFCVQDRRKGLGQHECKYTYKSINMDMHVIPAICCTLLLCVCVCVCVCV